MLLEPANARNVVSVAAASSATQLWGSSSHGPTEEGERGIFMRHQELKSSQQVLMVFSIQTIMAQERWYFDVYATCCKYNGCDSRTC